MAKKKVFVCVCYDYAKVGSFTNDTISEALSDYEYDSVEELFNNDEDLFYEIFQYNYESDYEVFLQRIDNVRVFDGKISEDRPYDVLSEKWDDTTDIKDLVGIQIKQIPVSNKGLAYKQISKTISHIAEMVVDEDFIFDPSKLLIKDASSIEYDGKTYNVVAADGDDNGDYVYYYDGIALNPKEEDDDW